MSAFFFFRKKFVVFSVENDTFTESNSMRALLDFLVLFSVFVRKQGYYQWKCFTDQVFEIWLPDCSKLETNKKNDNDVAIYRHVIVNIFWRRRVSLVKFSY